MAGLRSSISDLGPRFLVSSASWGMGMGSASGGMAPGFVVMALKCAATARNVTIENASEWKCPHLESLRIPSTS